MRAGCTLFPVSTRNAAVAVADMFKRTGTRHVVLSSDSVLHETAKIALSELESAGHSVVRLDLPKFEDLFAEKLDPASPLEAAVELPTVFDKNTLAGIMHSSGTSLVVQETPTAIRMLTAHGFDRFHWAPKDDWMDAQELRDMGQNSSYVSLI